MVWVTKSSDSIEYTAGKLKLVVNILSLDKSRCQWKGLGVKTNRLSVNALV